MRAQISMIVALLGLAGALGCAPTDDERCGKGFVWQDHTCLEEQPPPDTDSDTADGGVDGGDDLPEGMGESCTDEGGECDGFEADYCAIQPGNDVGYCTVTGCATSPDSCPGSYLCCDFPDGYGIENFCVTEADFELMSAMCQG